LPSPARAEVAVEESAAAAPIVNEVGDDRDALHSGDTLLLIVENDLGFARLLMEAARGQGFKCLVTSLGAVALAMAREYQPHAVTLDLCLPDIDGWRVLERLKNDTATRHIPVCVVSTEDESRDRALLLGALGVLPKPVRTQAALEELVADLKEFVTRPIKSLLVAAGDSGTRNRLVEWVAGPEIQITAAGTHREALQMIRERRIDCLVLSPDLPGLDPTALGEALRREPAPAPVIVYTDAEGHGTDGAELRPLAAAGPLRQARSPERLLDLAAFVLHAPVAKLPSEKRKVLEQLHRTDQALAGKKVLIVDDDIRNIFALTSVLERHHMVIYPAETGKHAISVLKAQPDIDLVLMDIMMPEMDGMETTREIRKLPAFRSLPIIAVTAKAMKGDREKCIEAGAWDYLSKPVDTEQMLAVLRAWLHR
jgi:CheY-like chemotaxis protein